MSNVWYMTLDILYDIINIHLSSVAKFGFIGWIYTKRFICLFSMDHTHYVESESRVDCDFKQTKYNNSSKSQTNVNKNKITRQSIHTASNQNDLHISIGKLS